MGREQSRGATATQVVEHLTQDVRYALRAMRHSRGFTAVTVLSLAVGIGANTAVFSVIDSLMIRTLPVPHPARLVNIQELWPGSAVPRTEYPTWEFNGLRHESTAFSEIAAISVFDRSNIALGGADGTRSTLDTGRARVAVVSGNYFSMLGIAAARGRTLTADDDRAPGQHPVAVISDDFWQRSLLRSDEVFKQRLIVNGTAFAVVGILPSGFTGDWIGRPIDFWVPTMMQGAVMIEAPKALTNTNDYWLRMVGRLRDGVTMAQAEAALQPIYQHTMREAAGPGASAQRLEDIGRQRIRLDRGSRGFSPQRDALAPSVRVLALLVALMLVVACVNVAGLLLSRSSARQREIAVRLAIGAGPGRLVRQLLTEGLLLALLGGAVGLAFAWWGTQLLSIGFATGAVQMFWARSSWISFDLHFSTRALLFTAAICGLTGLLFGIAPANRALHLSLTPSLAGRGATGAAGRFRLGRLLVVGQIALSLAVMIAAALLVRSLGNLTAQDLGFKTDHLLLVWTQPSSTGRSPAGLKDLWRQVQAQLSALPGVASASASNGAVLNGVILSEGRAVERMRVPGQPPRRTTAPGFRTFIAPGFFETLGVPLVSGREFSERDTETSPPVVMLNETMARFYFGAENPIGRRVEFGPTGTPPVEIVGVVKDFELGTPRAIGRPRMLTFFPYRDRTAATNIEVMCAVVRTHGDPRALGPRVRDALRGIEPTLAVLKVDTVGEQLNDVLAQDRLVAGLSAFFAIAVSLLCCLGLYALVAHMVAVRTSEIGIRLALGATRARVLGLVLREGLLLAAAGIVIGLPSTLAVGQLIASLLFGVRAIDPPTIVAATAIMTAVAALAGYLPARRASRVDPMVTLRSE